MDRLSAALRRELEKAVLAARVHAQTGAISALRRRAVEAPEPFAHFTEAEKELRRKLRARARLAGDAKRPDGTHAIDRVAAELAYEYWHRMLFARFLADNGLLMHPDGVAVSLEECQELAPDAEPPAPNGFALAARYASRMLPQIFRTDDVLLDIEFAPEHRSALEQLLADLPPAIFCASESLGWSYQFWQSRRKDQINASGAKIDGSTVAPVTQLFTETYMVEFLLHNTIGAWWASRHPDKTRPDDFPSLRRLEDGTPAAGAFPGWPDSVREFTLLDPCCGSYHFLVTAFQLLVPLRMREEGLTTAEAVDAVLRDNLHGIDIDPCCSKMAAFSLAFVAWRFRDETGEMLGYRPLPPLNIACSGQALDEAEKKAWLAFANGDAELRSQIDDLFTTFGPCYHVGSLIDPTRDCGPLFSSEGAEITRKLTAQLAKHRHDADAAAIGVAAQGLAKAAQLLSGKYTLVSTNVPYLGRGKQGEEIRTYLEMHYPLGKADLATAFVLRCLDLCAPGGSTALVTPQNWLFLTSYKKLREKVLKGRQWHFVVNLGEEAWHTFGIRGPRTILLGLTANAPAANNTFFGIDVSTNRGEPIIPLEEKVERLADRVPTLMQVVEQAGQLKNPDAKITIGNLGSTELLQAKSGSYQGLKTGDDERYRRCFWEVSVSDRWRKYQTTVEATTAWGGQEYAIDWLDTGKSMARLQGLSAWCKRGVVVTQMSSLAACLYDGAVFDSNVSAIVPHAEEDVLAVWAYCSSPEYRQAVRAVDQKVNVSNAALVQVPFDLTYWQAVAAEKYPGGLPEPHSNDPTQWLFRGDIATSTDLLQVAVARLLGYRWPDQPKLDAVVDPFVDDDGIVCLPGVRHEAPAAERLADLLRAVNVKTEVDLGVWLRDNFFADHCKRFHQRPFLWDIWDGRKDGFAALVNYHKLTHKTLENLTYSYLGDWIAAQGKSDKVGADLRLAAAQSLQAKLKLILAGEPPYDIFVRWKPLHEQAIGWHPDLNDGVRMNIRPFVEADILRKTPNIKWTKDRGKEPARDKDDFPWFNAAGDRVNDIHLTNAEKTAARAMKGAK